MLIVTVVALGIPLTINLQRRATAELETQALVQAQGIAAQVGAENVDDPDRLRQIVLEASAQVAGRVIVVDTDGILLADSDGPSELGTSFATPGRPEILSALDGVPISDIRDSADLGHDIMATAVPIQDEERLVGAVRISQNVQQVNDSVRNITRGLAAIGLAGLGAGLVLAFGLAGSLSKPLQRLAGTARRLGQGDLSARSGDVVVLDADLSGSTKTSKFAKAFPERFFNIGIAEQDMVGTAAGLALGRPANDGTPRVWYALVTATPDLSVELVPVDYDFETLARESCYEETAWLLMKARLERHNSSTRTARIANRASARSVPSASKYSMRETSPSEPKPHSSMRRYSIAPPPARSRPSTRHRTTIRPASSASTSSTQRCRSSICSRSAR